MNPIPEDRTITPEGESDQDARTIVQILDEYLARLESGEPMDRQQLLAAHPELADQLATRLDALDFMYGVAPQLAGDTPHNAEWPAHSTLKCLGDFRILREIGRGGMGVVYEAEQESLGRRVALKILPFAALMDSRQLQRFKNEARAAATLHHANIVPVYSVGFERGIHYFAMQLIEGSSLETILRQLRHAKAETTPDAKDATQRAKQNDAQSSPSVDTVPINALTTAYSRDRNSFFRQAARIAIDAAEALDHAHCNGIVHRDIKPANLLLDNEGRLWVTDFGLARLDVETGITMTGDVMGTLRYMSPEQAAGKRHVIDPRSDIYSLGATLYELLTLQPAFGSTDHPRLLRQIAEQEPRRLRSIDHSIPPDLETIVLKALQRAPSDRYDTAQDLADDLRRFLEEKVVQAKRPTRVTRAVRWARRHFEALSAVAVVLIISLIVAGTLITSAYRQEVRQRERAEANLQLAKETVDTMYTRFAEEWLSQDVANSDVQREFLERAVAFYDQLSEREASDPATQFDIAQTKIRVGRMYHWLGGEERLEMADRRLNEALSILNGILPHYEDERDVHFGLALCHYELQTMIGRQREADQQRRLRHLRDARRILTTLLDRANKDDEARDLLSGVIGRQGRIHCTTGEFDEAKNLFVEARQVAEDIQDETTRRRALAVCDENVTSLPPSQYPNEDREESALRVVEYWRSKQNENPRDANVGFNLAVTLNKLASLRFNNNIRVEEGLPNLIEAAQILTGVVKQAPDLATARELLITLSWNLRLFPQKLGLNEPQWREVIELQRQVLEACPDGRDRLAAAEPLLWSLDGLARSHAKRNELNKTLEVADEFWQLTSQQNALRTDGKWPSRETNLPNLRLCELFVTKEQPAAAYRHCMALAQYTHGCVQAAGVTPLEEQEVRDRLLNGFLGTSNAFQLVVDAWGSESLIAACRDAVSRKEFGADELWPLQVYVEIETGNSEQALAQITPLLERKSLLPFETLLYALATRISSTDVKNRHHVIELVKALIAIRQARSSEAESGWQEPNCGAFAHSVVTDAYIEKANWARAAQHGRRTVQLVEQALHDSGSDFRGYDVREPGSEYAMKCAMAHFQLKEFDPSKQMALFAIKLLDEILVDKPENQAQRRALSQAWFHLAEAEYAAGRNEAARRAYDKSLRNLREVLTSRTTDHEMEDRRRLCGMLTRNPFSPSIPIEEAQQLSERLLGLSPDNPTVLLEVAWVEYRVGNSEGARTKFLQVLESSATDDEQKRLALTGLALAENALGFEAEARDSFRHAIETFEKVRDETVFGMQEHGMLMEVAKKLGQEAFVDRIFVEQ